MNVKNTLRILALTGAVMMTGISLQAQETPPFVVVIDADANVPKLTDDELWERAVAIEYPVGERDMMSGGIRLSLDYGNYDLLLYNNDYESLRINPADDWSSVTATTDSDPYAQPLPDSITPNGYRLASG